MPDLCFYAPWIMKEPIPDPFRIVVLKLLVLLYCVHY